MTTFLALTQRLQLEAAVSGTITTLANVTGDFLRLKTWIQQGYADYQNERFNWEYLRSSQLLGQGVSFQTVSGQAEYPLGLGAGTVGVAEDDFASWIPRSFRDQTTTSGVQDQFPLAVLGYDAWRDTYAMGSMQTVTTRPVAIAVGPNNSICVGPYPTSTYTLTGDFYLSPRLLTTDTDEPTVIPVQFQIGIVWRALWYYGMYEAAPEVVTRAEKRYRQTCRQLGNLRTYQVTAGRALA